MWEVGDKALCIRSFRRRPYGRVPDEFPQVGLVYEVAQVRPFWRSSSIIGLNLAGLGGWVWNSTWFRKVKNTDFEEPRRLVTEKEQPKERELEDA